MAENYVVVVEGLESLKSFDDIPAEIARKARMAVNKTLDRTRTRSQRSIRMQVKFPSEYLGPSGGRLTVSRRANDASLEGAITGRERPTSLARFASGRVAGKGAPTAGGVSVEVKPGLAQMMRGVFLVKLRSGNTDTKNNLGLAMRTRDGRPPKAAYKPGRLGPNLWLLYGPSVAQVFRSVSDEEAPDAADFLESEFLRLMDL